MKFRIRTLLWVMALFASALATFAAFGILVATLVLVFWACLLKVGPAKTLAVLLVALILAVLVALFLPARSTASEAAVHNSCMNNLKLLALSLHSYHDREKQFPMAYTVVDGKPAHSWRTMLLPELEAPNLYKQIDLTEPWNGPHNKRLLGGVRLEPYQCPAERINQTALTDYFAIVDSRTVWPPDRPGKFEDIKDGTANTILLVEAPHRNANWFEPVDLSFDEAVDLFTTVPSKKDPVGHKVQTGFFGKPSYGINVVFADGRGRFVPLPLDREIAVALLTKAGGEEIDPAELRSAFEPELDYGKVFALCAFLFIAVLPALKSRSQANVQSEAVGAAE